MKKMAVLLTMMAVFSFLFCNIVVAFPPLPDDLNIVQPDPSLPKELAAFSGKWQGHWYNPRYSGGFDAILIVEKIEPEKAIVIYCWGDSAEWRIRKGHTGRLNATLSKVNGKYVLSWDCPQIGTKYEFSLRGKKLEGYSTKSGNMILMKRIDK